MTKIIIKDGVRYPEAFAQRHGIKADETRELNNERVRTTTAVGVTVVDDVSGKVITSAADPSGADDSQVPTGTNLGLTDPELTPAQKRAQKKAAAASTTSTEGTTNGEAPAGDSDGPRDADGTTGS